MSKQYTPLLTQKELDAGHSVVRRFTQRKRRQSLRRWFRAFVQALTFTLILWAWAATGFLLATRIGPATASALITVAAIITLTYLYAKE